MARFALLCLLLPLFASAQVELVRTFPSWEVSRLKESYEHPASPFLKETSFRIGNRLVYNALIGATYWENNLQTWVIDEAGNRQVIPYVGDLLRLADERWVSTLQNRLFALDPQTLQRTPLFDEVARVLGDPQQGRVLAVVQHDQHSSLWSIDGSLGGNLLLMDTVQVTFNIHNRSVNHVSALDGRWAFVSTDRKVILSDGTPQGTRVVRQFDHEVELIGLTPQRAILFYPNLIAGLNLTDGDLMTVQHFIAGAIASRGPYRDIRAQCNGKVIFTLQMNDSRHTLWASDGTQAGTRRLTYIPNRDIASQGNGLHVIGNKAFFLNSNAFDSGGWETDGYLIGTRRMEAPPAGPVIITNEHRWGEDRVFLVGRGAHQATGLWMLTGSKLIDVTPWHGYGGGLNHQGWPQTLFIGTHHTYFQAFSPGRGREMHRINRDGIAELVADLSPGIAWSEVTPVGQAGPWVYFAANQPGGGARLYRVRDDQPLTPPTTLEPLMYTWQQGLAGVWGRTHLDPKVRATELTKGRDGDVYVAGTYDSPNGLATAMGRVFTLPREGDVQAANHSGRQSNFLVRFRGDSGLPAWAMTLGNKLSSTIAPVIAPAPDNGIYLSAQVASTAFLHIGDQTLPSSLGQNTLIARVDSSGRLLWYESGHWLVQTMQMETDPQGNLIAGIDLLSSDAILAANSFSNVRGLPPGRNWAAAKFQPDGTLLWAVILAPRTDGFALRRMGTDDAGRIYLMFSRQGASSAENPCEARVDAEVRVMCLHPDGRIAWERIFRPGPGVSAADMAVSGQGRVYICGHARGNLQFGSLKRLQNCEQWQSYVLILSNNGTPASLQLLEEEEGSFAFSIAVDSNDGYILSGIMGAPQAPLPYAHLAARPPYENTLFRQFFVRYYTVAHRLQDEKRWFQTNREPGTLSPDQNHFRSVHMGGSDFVYMNTYSSPLDTFAHVPQLDFRASGTMIMRLSMSELPAPPPIEGRELSASDIEAFPNPVSGWLTISSGHSDFPAAPLRLFNSMGQEIALPAVTAAGPYRYIDMSRLPAGVYMIGILHGKDWVVKRVAVQH